MESNIQHNRLIEIFAVEKILQIFSRKFSSPQIHKFKRGEIMQRIKICRINKFEIICKVSFNWRFLLYYKKTKSQNTNSWKNKYMFQTYLHVFLRSKWKFSKYIIYINFMQYIYTTKIQYHS
jgi:hypothetical protein